MNNAKKLNIVCVPNCSKADFSAGMLPRLIGQAEVSAGMLPRLTGQAEVSARKAACSRQPNAKLSQAST